MGLLSNTKTYKETDSEVCCFAGFHHYHLTNMSMQLPIYHYTLFQSEMKIGLWTIIYVEKIYHKIKTFGDKKPWWIWQLQQYAKIFADFHNLNNMACGFTITYCPSMLERLLGLPLIMPQLTNICHYQYSLAFPYSCNVAIATLLAVLLLAISPDVFI